MKKLEYVKAEAETIQFEDGDLFTAANASCTYRGTNNGQGNQGGNNGHNNGEGGYGN